MLSLFGSKKRLCDGICRRDLLHIGSAGLLTLADSHALRPLQAETSDCFGKAKGCILVFLFGSPPQHETFDPKPEAPAEIQGELGAIETNVPGLRIGAGLPQCAAVMDRVTVVRSMCHPYPLHGVAYALSGMPTYTPAIEAQPRHTDHWPFLGSVVDHLEERRTGRRSPTVPRNVALPWLFGAKSDLAPLAGPYAGFLGNAHDPLWTEFVGEGTRVVPPLADAQTAQVRDPFAGIDRAGSFRLSAACEFPEEVGPARFDARRHLLAEFDQARAWLDATAPVAGRNSSRERAYALITSDRVRRALDLQHEPASVRERYGMTLFGQALLAARRLIEAGCQFVSVFWDPFGPFGGSVWDTHANHFPRLREYLLPVFDQTYSALILDLDQRGLLDETLVLCMSEHGRTPRIDSKPKGAGRHHWSRAYSAVYAGGGIARGRVVGRSDSIGGDVIDTPISPKDVQATAYHLLGIDPHTSIIDRLGRPVPIAGDGKLCRPLLA